MNIKLLSAIIFTSGLFLSNTSIANESKRAALLKVIDQQIAIQTNLGNHRQVENLQNSKNLTLQFNSEQLASLPSEAHLIELEQATMKLERQTLTSATNKILGSFSTKATTTLTAADYPDFPLCATAPGERHSDLAVFISEQALFVAEAVRELAARGCEQVAVAAGFGGNTSAACIVTDAVYIAAKEAHNIISFCDAEVDEAQLEATFLRTEDLFNLGHEISDELANHDMSMQSLISDHDADIKADISQHDADIKASLTQQGIDIINRINEHDNDIKQALSLHDMDIKNMLNQVIANQGQILINQEEIIQLLKTPSGRRDGWNR